MVTVENQSLCHHITFLDDHTGDVICRLCGEVFRERNIVDQTRRAYSLTDHIIRDQYFPAPIFDSPSLGFTLNPQVRYGKEFMERYCRLKYIGHQCDAKTRNAIYFYNRIELFCSQLHLPHAILQLEIQALLKQYMKYKTFRGTCLNNYIPTFLYYACHRLHIVIDVYALAEVSQIPHDRILFLYRRDLIPLFNILFTKISFNPFEVLLPGIFTTLNVDHAFQQKIQVILNYIVKKPFVFGKNPRCIIGGILYYCAQKIQIHLTQEMIADACHTNVVSVRNNYHLIKQFFDRLHKHKK